MRERTGCIRPGGWSCRSQTRTANKFRRSVIARLKHHHIGIGAAALGALALLWALKPNVPAFAEFEAGPERKQAFFDYFAPLVHDANAEILETRATVQALLAEREDLGFLDRLQITSIAEEFGLPDFDPGEQTDWETLLRRVDIVPTSLALAQGAKESGWGTSRFAREGYNYFGQWCFESGCGLVPSQRPAGQTHEVAVFSDPEEAVDAYLKNLNSNDAYEPLRNLRARQRAQEKPIDALDLAAGLLEYSGRGQAYVDEVRSMIRYNELQRFDRFTVPTGDRVASTD